MEHYTRLGHHIREVLYEDGVYSANPIIRKQRRRAKDNKHAEERRG